MLAAACDERVIVTIEGFAGDQVMAVLRDAFHRHHGLQCGFCTPAMLIAAHDMIGRGRAGSTAEVRRGLAGNLCRCTGYTNIVAAIVDAAATLEQQPRHAG
jgi:carbon-monoxide dehydrogenase small subunit